jgi:hypothetical protein
MLSSGSVICACQCSGKTPNAAKDKITYLEDSIAVHIAPLSTPLYSKSTVQQRSGTAALFPPARIQCCFVPILSSIWVRLSCSCSLTHNGFVPVAWFEIGESPKVARDKIADWSYKIAYDAIPVGDNFVRHK